MIKETKT